jgi:bacteriocin-like protein
MNLENLGVQEMNTTELKQVEGGFLVLLACCVIALCCSGCGAYTPLRKGKE